MVISEIFLSERELSHRISEELAAASDVFNAYIPPSLPQCLQGDLLLVLLRSPPLSGLRLRARVIWLPFGSLSYA